MHFKKYIVLLYLFAGLSMPGIFQESFSISNYIPQDSLHKHALIIGSSFYLNSSGFNNRFLRTSYNQKEFSADDMDHMINTSSNNVLSGFDVCSNIGYRKQLNNSSYGLFFGLAEKIHFDSRLSSNAYKLLLQGNQPFEGELLELENTEANFLHYQQASIGGTYSSKEKEFTMAASVNVINGSDYFLGSFPSVRLYTEPYGEYLNIEVEGLVYQTQSEKKVFFKNNGLGASVDFFSEIQFNLFQNVDSNKVQLSLEINDLGFIQWKNNSYLRQIDTSFVEFRGVNLNELITDTNYLPFDTSQTLFNKLNNRGSFISYLPAYFHMALAKPINKHFIKLGVVQRAAANYHLYLYAQDEYEITNNVHVLGRLAYGAYGKVGVGAGVKYKIKNWNLFLSSNHLEGLLVPKYSAGNQGVIQIQKIF